MSNLNKYLSGAAMRKPMNEREGVIDTDVLFRLQEDDMPRHQEIIRILSIKLRQFAEFSDETSAELADEMIAGARAALDKVEEIAIDGDNIDNAFCTHEHTND